MPTPDVDFLSSRIYDTLLWLLSILIDLFFREVRTRGSFRVPRYDPVIFVAAPHSNQFVDPLILARQVRIEAKRRVGFLIAEKSTKRRFIGFLARNLGAIPCARVEDLAKNGHGVLFRNPGDDEHIVRGRGNQFREFSPGTILILPNNGGSAEIETVEDDNILTLKKNFRGREIANNLLLNVDGCRYKYSRRVDQHKVYDEVYRRLNLNGCIGIFPEGGSHDRTELLPLKAGVAIMALGFQEKHPDKDLKIVPCGLNYFHAHKFRSRAVVEFGNPIEIPAALVEKYKSGYHRQATGQLLSIISNALGTVTIQVPDFETLQVVQAGRRLYRPSNNPIPLAQIVELNRRFIKGYERLKDDPKVSELRQEILVYNRRIYQMGIRDHQLTHAKLDVKKVIMLLIWRTLNLLVLAWLALPGAILFSPVFIATRRISQRKAKEALQSSTVKVKAKDVIATWKLLVALGFAPVLYLLYSLLATVIFYHFGFVDGEKLNLVLCFLMFMIIIPTVTIAALRFGETGMDIYKSLRPLVLALIPSSASSIEKLRTTREHLSEVLTELINSRAPDLFPDFVKSRSVNDNYETRDIIHSEPSRSGNESPTGSDTSSISSRRIRLSTSSSFDNVFDMIGHSPTISREDSFIIPEQRNNEARENSFTTDEVSIKIRESIRELKQRRRGLKKSILDTDSLSSLDKNISSSDEDEHDRYD